MSRLAIDGGDPVRTAPFPAWPVFGDQEERALIEVLRSGKWGALDGSKVKQFQKRFAAFQDAKHGICVVNGTFALEVALRAAGVGPGDEVIVPSYTFIATATSVLAVGARPVFADVDPQTMQIDPTSVEERVNSRTRAVIPVHLAGHPADLDAIMAIAERYGITVIEDAAQSHGAAWKGRRVGAIGHLGTFSFQTSKNITAGEGGILVTNDDALAARVWSIHNVGRVPGGLWYQHESIGWNLRMTEFQAAVLLCQLDRAEEHLHRRQVNAAALSGLLVHIDGVEPLTVDSRVTSHAWHIYLFRYEPAMFGGMDKNTFIRCLQTEGIPAAPGYIPLHRNRAMRQALWEQFGVKVEDIPPCPTAERACDETVVWLPQSVLMGTSQDLASIAQALEKIQEVASQRQQAK
jgi:dTDP-4-amino-4,6-dideoxygalactose transaminase